ARSCPLATVSPVAASTDRTRPETGAETSSASRETRTPSHRFPAAGGRAWCGGGGTVPAGRATVGADPLADFGTPGAALGSEQAFASNRAPPATIKRKAVQRRSLT